MQTTNLVGLAVNVSRAVEIAKLGNHSIKLIETETGRPEDIAALVSFYGVEQSDNPEIMVEVCMSPEDIFNCLAYPDRCEKLGDITDRVKEAKNNSRPSFDFGNNSCTALLKAAINRLSLSFVSTQTIISVAETIAQAHGGGKVLPEHVAEAIHYRVKSTD